MKNSIVVVLVLVILIGLGVWLTRLSKNASTTKSNSQTNSATNSSDSGTNKSSTSPVDVTISSFAFSPQTVTIKAGTIITFTNNDGVDHTVTNDVGNIKFDVDVNAGQKMNLTISTPGTYDYHCKIHPEMTGTIIVQ